MKQQTLAVQQPAVAAGARAVAGAFGFGGGAAYQSTNASVAMARCWHVLSMDITTKRPTRLLGGLLT
jgi:hypothetical protein